MSREETGNARIYKVELDKLNDLTRWRKTRRKLRDYAMADTVRELFTPGIDAEWKAELAAKESRLAEPSSMALTLTGMGSADLRLPVVGYIAAGPPLELLDSDPDSEFDFKAAFNRDGYFMFQVRGDSMIEYHVMPGDKIVVREQTDGDGGQVVVAVLDNALTLKKLVLRREEIWLHAYNQKVKPMRLRPERGDKIIGVLVGVVRVLK